MAAALLLASTAEPQGPAQPETRRSGFDYMSPAIQAIQRDDTQNPAMLWVKDGEVAWQRDIGPGPRSSCASCHGDATQSMRGVATRYPAFDARLDRPISLQQRINQCRERYQIAPPLPIESRDLLNLESYVAHQSRGMPVAPPTDARLSPWRERGERLFGQRMGQLDLSCAQCHDGLAGKRLGGNPIPQAHLTGFPIYRLEWQGVGSFQRRLRNCMTGIRAEPFVFGSAETVQLELFLALRARGMPLETPAVRP
ncbi:MAG TPA: sulfur oxidation c-type cytochrome SoxA [Burkholderiaceae bacterium]|nr:sulfur oxidation c-type cytochrome SoxA [Burkholderiaceae bacterium]